MSASTRTIQQPLGFGQIGAALAVVAMAIIVAALVAFGSMGAAKTEVTPAVGAPPAVIDHGWSQAGTSTGPAAGAPPAVIDHGWSQAGTSTSVDDDGRKGIPFTPGTLAKSSGASASASSNPPGAPIAQIGALTLPPRRRPDRGGVSVSAGRSVPTLAPCDNRPTMPPDDRFDDLAQSLGGFYQSWVIYLGLQLGLFALIHAAEREGITPAELATAADCAPDAVEAWVRAAHASELLEHDGTRLRMDEAAASVLLDESRPEYLGGQFVVAVVSSLDYAGLPDFFKTGRPIEERPPRFHRAIEAVTVQDIAVFFQEGLAELPDLAGQLAAGSRILDVACGGGKWLIAIATRFPATELVGVEFEPDSVARAMRRVTDAGLESRIKIEAREIPAMPYVEEFDFVYMQDALHELPDPVASLKAAWKAVRPGGRLVVFEWCLPSSLEDSQNLQAELMWGIQIDELYQGTRMYTHDGFDRMFAEAEVPPPSVVELPSAASLFVVARPA